MELSVVICTYNRDKILDEAFSLLTAQTADRNSYEIIIVDNASTDNTKAIADSHRQRLNLIYAYESNLGLSYARNLGIKLAKAAFIAYLDDDSRPNPDWISVILNTIRVFNPDIFGGAVFPYYQSPKPAWFLDKDATFGYWGDTVSPLGRDEYLSGNNIVFRKELLERLGGFNPQLGMRGTNLGYHEEAEIVKKTRAVLPYAKILYVPEMSLRHLVPAYKMRLGWYVRRIFAAAKSEVILKAESMPDEKTSPWLLLKRATCQLMRLLFKCSFAAVFRNRERYQYYQRYIIDTLEPDFYVFSLSFNSLLFRIKPRHA
jgi:glycosyltransferase involved in cell wall biosynthesis